MATEVGAVELPEVEAFCVVLAEDHGQRVEIQRSLSFDTQDRANGQDTYCISVTDGSTHYGGVTAWSIDAGALEVLLGPEAARALGVDGGFVIQFPLQMTDKLRAGLERVFGFAATR